MAIPTLLLPLDGDLEGLDRDGPTTATGSGALRWVPGMAPGTQAALVEEGTTNLIRNPHAVTLDGIGGNDIAYELVEGFSPDGTGNSVKFTSDASSGFEYAIWNTPVPVGGPTTARTFTGSIWVLGEAGLELDLVMRIRMLRGGSFRNHDIIQPIICTGEWTRFTVTGSTQNGDDLTTQATSIQVARSYSNFNIRSAATFYATGAQFEEKPYATTLCPQLDRDGNLLPGYAWTGTEHASPSTRQAALVQHPTASALPDLSRFSIAIRFRIDALTGVMTDAHPLVFAPASGNDRFDWVIRGIGIMRIVTSSANGTQQISDSPLTVTPGQWHDAYLGHAGGKVTLRLDGEEYVAITNAAIDAIHSQMDIGGRSRLFSPQYLNGRIGGVMFFDRELSMSAWNNLRATETWTWGMLYPRLGGVMRVDGGGAPFSVLRAGYGEE